ncbi:choice-of-anchor tandem repeat GloVer-containing protein, partial [Acinetobacter baumannii]
FDSAYGATPEAGLVQGVDGFFYGTSNAGGDYSEGAVFQISPSGTFKIQHSFGGIDGNAPDAGLVVGTDGNLYGTTAEGGIN